MLVLVWNVCLAQISIHLEIGKPRKIAQRQQEVEAGAGVEIQMAQTVSRTSNAMHPNNQ